VVCFLILHIGNRPGGIALLFSDKTSYGRRWGTLYNSLNETRLFFVVPLLCVVLARSAIMYEYLILTSRIYWSIKFHQRIWTRARFSTSSCPSCTWSNDCGWWVQKMLLRHPWQWMFLQVYFTGVRTIARDIISSITCYKQRKWYRIPYWLCLFRLLISMWVALKHTIRLRFTAHRSWEPLSWNRPPCFEFNRCADLGRSNRSQDWYESGNLFWCFDVKLSCSS
jgi:hypothetical protein